MSGSTLGFVVMAAGLLVGLAWMVATKRRAEAQAAVPVKAGGGASSSARKVPWGTVGLVAGAVVAFGASWAVQRAYMAPVEPEPQHVHAGQMPAGHPPMGGHPGAGSGMPSDGAHRGVDIDKMVRYAETQPENTEMASFVTHELIRFERFEDARRLLDAARATAPDHLELEIHAVVVDAFLKEDLKGAVARLAELGARGGPDAAEAHLFRGALALQIGDQAAALQSLETFTQVAPPEAHPRDIAQVMTSLRAGKNPSALPAGHP